MAEAGQARQGFAAEGLQPSGGLGALEGQQHPITLAIADEEALGLELAANPGGVRFGAGGVDHQHQLIGFSAAGVPGGLQPGAAAPVVNDQVVADAAGLVQQHRIASFARTDAKQVGGQQSLQGVLDAVALKGQHSHVGDVEDTDVLAHRLVFLHQAAKLHRHLPASERHQTATRSAACLPEGSTAQAAVRGRRQVGHGGAVGGGWPGSYGPWRARRKAAWWQRCQYVAPGNHENGRKSLIRFPGLGWMVKPRLNSTTNLFLP